ERRALGAHAGWRWSERIARKQWMLRGLLAGLGELDRPGALLAGIDFEEAGTIVAAGETIADAADGELLVARAHEGRSHPFAAAVIVDGVDIVEAGDEVTLEHGLTTAGRQVPPAFGGPTVGVLIADRNADPASGVVAKREIGRRRPG